MRRSLCRQITRGNSDKSSRRLQTIHLIRENLPLWTQGCDLYPPPGTHVLKLPFQFTLPDPLPPSCQYWDLNMQGKVGYVVEVVAKRSGIRFDKRFVAPFAVIPSHAVGAQLRATLAAGWQGQWKTIEATKGIRRGIWGEFSHVKMTVRFPFSSKSLQEAHVRLAEWNVAHAA